ncbi:MAG: hypothetical protein VB859_06575, partial [Planctomycetaceae bacterium]
MRHVRQSACLSTLLGFLFPALVTLLVCSPHLRAQDPTGRVGGFQPRVYAITGARLVMAPGRELARGTLVIRDGLIVAAGAQVTIPADAVQVDGSGLVAYAGFIDGDADDLLTPSPVLPAPPGRPVDFSRYVLAATRPDNRKSLTPQFAAEKALKLDAALLTSIRRDGFTSVHVVPSGRIASGTAALVSTAGVPPRESLVAAPTIAAFALAPPNGNDYPKTLMGVHAHLRQALLDARRFAVHRQLYAKSTNGVPRPPADDVLGALVTVLEGRRRAAFRVSTRDDIHRALAFCQEQKIKPVLLGVAEANDCLEELADQHVDLLMSMQFGSTPKIQAPMTDQGLKASRPSPVRVQKDLLNRWRDRVAAIGRLQRRGLTLAVGSRGLKNRAALLTAVRQAIARGWSATAALATLTTHAAHITGVGTRLGTLDPGRLGHVVLWTGRFEDAKSKVRFVLVDGILFEYNHTAKPRPVKQPANGKSSGTTAPKQIPPQLDNQPPPVPPLPRQIAADQLPSELESDRRTRSIQTGGNVLVRNATVLTGTGKTHPGHSILVRRGKIIAIGANLKPDPGMTVIDATGRFVMPGIIDTHSHIKITQGINESTLSIVPEVRIKDVINTADVGEFRALAGGVTTARLLHGSANVVGGQDAVVKLKYGKTASEQILHDAPQGVKFALGENVKFRTTRFPNTRMGVEATLNRAFLEAIDYRRRWQQYTKARQSAGGPTLLPPRRDLRLEALADLVNHKKFIHSHCYRSDEILMLLRVASNLGIRVWSLQHVLEGYKI